MTLQSIHTYAGEALKICELTNAELETVFAAAAQRGCALSDSGHGGVSAHLETQIGADQTP